jgi:phosphatidate cytidylyltransferase
VALHIQTFKTRTLTAVLFAIVMLAGLLINKWSFILLFLIIMVGGVYEYFKLIRKISPGNYLYYSPLVLIYIVMPVIMMIDSGITINEIHTAGQKPYPSFIEYSPLYPCAVIFSIWINDTMAYIVGSMIGKTPFSKISPKKTWEGTVGGAILCVAVIALLSGVIPVAKDIPVIHWIWIAALCAFFGTLGDLLESKLKRMAGVKDSGTFMPGHGGFLDRFDSMLVAIPFVWLYIRLFL